MIGGMDQFNILTSGTHGANPPGDAPAVRGLRQGRRLHLLGVGSFLRDPGGEPESLRGGGQGMPLLTIPTLSIIKHEHRNESIGLGHHRRLYDRRGRHRRAGGIRAQEERRGRALFPGRQFAEVAGHRPGDVRGEHLHRPSRQPRAVGLHLRPALRQLRVDGGLHADPAVAVFRAALSADARADAAGLSGAPLQPELPRRALDRLAVLGHRHSHRRGALHGGRGVVFHLRHPG